MFPVLATLHGLATELAVPRTDARGPRSGSSARTRPSRRRSAPATRVARPRRRRALPRRLRRRRRQPGARPRAARCSRPRLRRLEHLGTDDAPRPALGRPAPGDRRPRGVRRRGAARRRPTRENWLSLGAMLERALAAAADSLTSPTAARPARRAGCAAARPRCGSTRRARVRPSRSSRCHPACRGPQDIGHSLGPPRGEPLVVRVVSAGVGVTNDRSPCRRRLGARARAARPRPSRSRSSCRTRTARPMGPRGRARRRRLGHLDARLLLAHHDRERLDPRHEDLGHAPPSPTRPRARPPAPLPVSAVSSTSEKRLIDPSAMSSKDWKPGTWIETRSTSAGWRRELRGHARRSRPGSSASDVGGAQACCRPHRRAESAPGRWPRRSGACPSAVYHDPSPSSSGKPVLVVAARQRDAQTDRDDLLPRCGAPA